MHRLKIEQFIIYSVAVWLLAAADLLAAGTPAVLSHNLVIKLDPAAHSLTASDTLVVRTSGASVVAFEIGPRVRVSSVTLLPGGKARAGGSRSKGPPRKPERLRFRLEGSTLEVSLPTGFRGDEATLALAYEGIFNDPVPDRPLNTEDPSYGVAGTITPRGVFLLPEAGWYPDLPGSMPAFLLRVEAPRGIEAVTSGERIRHETAGGRSISEWRIDHPIRGLALSAGPYVVHERRFGGIPVMTYFYPETDPLAEPYLDATVEALRLYSDLIGPYPFPKFAVVENFFPTGYGFPSYTLLGSSVIRLPFIVKTSLVHEVAHSWFGNGVFAPSHGGNWTEGLTAYLADHLAQERVSEQEAREYRSQILRDYATLVPPEGDLPLAAFTGRTDPATRVVGYGKGAMVFHMARRMVGDETFWGALREIYRQRLFQAVSWSDFEEALDRRAGGGLKGFFAQWVHRKGAPRLSLDAVQATRTEEGWRVTGALLQEEPAYALSVPLRLEAEGQSTDATVRLSGREGRFTLSTPTAPQRLTVDPGCDLFRRLYPEEIPPMVNTIRGSQALIVVASRNMSPEVLEASRALLTALGLRDVRILSEEAFTPDELKGHDVLFLGTPRNASILPDLPRGWALASDRFTADGETYTGAGDAAFLAMPHPLEPGRTVAVFHPLSPQAAASVARKLPHYGKTSLLAFREGMNTVKRIWPIAKSPLMISFERPAAENQP